MIRADKRHGTTTLFAAFNVLDGTAIGLTMPRAPLQLARAAAPLPAPRAELGAACRIDRWSRRCPVIPERPRGRRESGP